MTARTFVDTNIWVYAVDAAEPEKQSRARAVLGEVDAQYVVSAQVLGEFYVTVTRRFERTVSAADARGMVAQLRRLPVVAIDADHVEQAIQGSQAWGVSYWDALILAAAATAGCTRVLTEDLADGTTYGTVTVENPFRAPRKVSESAANPYGHEPSQVLRWTDEELLDALAGYERECADAGMTRNAVHSYWDYARRFLAWRTGDYVLRGSAATGRPIPPGPASVEDLAEEAAEYEAALSGSTLSRSAVDTYHRHAMFFVRWLAGSFKPGGRLRSRYQDARQRAMEPTAAAKPRGGRTWTRDDLYAERLGLRDD
jgi:predicted nucleic acid-binding protein